MIKPCPFCGSEAKLITCAESCNVGGVVVECRKCCASGPVVFGCKDDPNEHAMAAWNRRTTSPSKSRFTEEQEAAFAKAIFDNDYTDMERLKAEGKWIKTADSTVSEHKEIRRR